MIRSKRPATDAICALSVEITTRSAPSARASSSLPVERETSAAYTSSHLCAMTVLAQVATDLGERREAPGVAGFRAALEALPDQVADALAREEEIAPIAEYAAGPRADAAGAGPYEATAQELVGKARGAACAQEGRK